MATDPHDLVQRQFGANAERYVHSTVHAGGASLQRLLDLAAPQPDWLALDVAPGGGHSALIIAPHVRRVLALDLTFAMLTAARSLAGRQGQGNLAWVQGDGASLPLPDRSLDLVTCRVALHHFPDQPAALREWARVLRPGGRLVLVDNIGPDEAAACAYVNAFERLRDPSHGWMHPLPALLDFIAAAGLSVQHSERLTKPMLFQPWMDRMQVAPADRRRLSELLWGSAGAARAFLDPQGAGEAVTFSLREGVIAAQR
ncbi:MAG: class I SAM-dependent methyltransferase [Caldilineales bacterium]|nr:class I SAM-dependent methyltransferase [Caldilineales bacterium]